MLTYRFMQVAFAVCFLLGLVVPLVGSSAVYKRLSSSGDALAHSSLAGIVIGLVSGLNPLLISIISCIVSFFIIELLRKKFNKYSEIGVAVVLSLSIGLAGLLSSFTSSSNFDSYLFGSILLISNVELYLTIALSIIILIFSIVFYFQIFSTLYSETESKVSKIKINILTIFQDLLLSITIAVGCKVVGSLVISSLIVLPTAIALQLKKGYFVTMISSVVFSITSMIVGLTMSFYLNLKPGATIVLIQVSLIIIMFIFNFIASKIRYKKKI